MAKIGFLGLGEMGRPMASRLLRAGHDLVVWNRSAERTMPLAEEGATLAPSPAKAAIGADFVITMLATPEALEQVLFGTAGLAPALSPGQVLIDMSTVGPDEVRSVAARLPKGVSLVDAPVRGSVPQATSTYSWVPMTRTTNAFGRFSKPSARYGTRAASDREPP